MRSRFTNNVAYIQSRLERTGGDHSIIMQGNKNSAALAALNSACFFLDLLPFIFYPSSSL